MRAIASSAASIPHSAFPGSSWRRRWCSRFAAGRLREHCSRAQIPDHRRTIDFPLSETKRLTGLDIDDIAALTTLSRLGFSFSSEDRFAKVIPPSWRPDIEGKADLVEEITRIGGLDRVPSTPFPRH